MSTINQNARPVWRRADAWLLGSAVLVAAGLVVIAVVVDQFDTLHRQRIMQCNSSRTVIRAQDAPWSMTVLGAVPAFLFLTATGCVVRAYTLATKYRRALVAGLLVPVTLVALCGGFGILTLTVHDRPGFVCHHGP